ncbi:hypothetical protein [Lactococcus lactis]|uniref:Uncharacterized protein n=1 Tax=Lactococcus lactis TaxID=1358 RepID=A0A6B3S0M4_9LACT|nr:hypothetical protein [Lactococcus lactis]NEX51293.1 hypothetical protein [Lactococcus lactis]NEX51870.1 hypothetical protein [Lactococcus lactis]NEX56460.1 hypothetical protein [Lactococcus lactis]
MVTTKKKDFAILIAIATAASIILAALTKLLKAYGKYKIDCAKAYSIKKSAYRRRR